jgi:hypothetical protein
MQDDGQTDPNQAREEVPFPNPNGPPRYQFQPQPQQHQPNGRPRARNGQFLRGAPGAMPQPEQQPMTPQMAQQQAGVSYDQPPYQQPQPYPGQVAQAAQPMLQQPLLQQIEQPQLVSRLQQIAAGYGAGALEVALVWAQHLAIFRNEVYQRTGQYLSDREAFEIISTSLVMAMDE